MKLFQNSEEGIQVNRTNQFLLIFAVGLLTQPMLAHAQADYDYQTIDYPGTDYTQVFGINARGHVVGTASDEESCFPFVYHSKNATFTDVAPVAGFDCTHVLGISDSGYLVGGVTTDDPFSRSGLILDKSGNVTLFDHPDAFSETMARGVNNDGLVTGYIDTIDPNEILRGFIHAARPRTRALFATAGCDRWTATCPTLLSTAGVRAPAASRTREISSALPWIGRQIHGGVLLRNLTIRPASRSPSHILIY
jgi:hypothetical protein